MVEMMMMLMMLKIGPTDVDAEISTTRKRCMDLVSFETESEYNWVKGFLGNTQFFWTSGRSVEIVVVLHIMTMVITITITIMLAIHLTIMMVQEMQF